MRGNKIDTKPNLNVTPQRREQYGRKRQIQRRLFDANGYRAHLALKEMGAAHGVAPALNEMLGFHGAPSGRGIGWVLSEGHVRAHFAEKIELAENQTHMEN